MTTTPPAWCPTPGKWLHRNIMGAIGQALSLAA